MPIITTPDSYTKLLIHSDHSNNSTSIVDSSASNHTITLSGNVKHSTAQSKFGKSSLYFDGSGDYLTLADNADWDWGSGDWTVECWLHTSPSASTRIFSKQGTYYQIYCRSAGEIEVQYDGGDSLLLTSLTGGDLPPSNTWFHYAYVKYGNTVSLYMDGKFKKSDTVSGSHRTVTDALNIGAYAGGVQPYTGYMDEIRFSKGIARWTSEFTPPNKPYSVVDDDFVTDIANIEDDATGNTTFGSNIVVRSDPSEASTDSVFSVNAKDGTELMNMSANGVLESGLLKVDAEGAVHVYNPHAGIYMTSFSDLFAASESKTIQMKTNVNVFGSMFINVTGDYGNTNAIGAYEKCFSVGVNSVNTGIYSPGSAEIVEIGGTANHFSFGTPVKPDAVTYNIPVTNTNSTYAVSFYINVVFKGYTTGIVSIKLV